MLETLTSTTVVVIIAIVLVLLFAVLLMKFFLPIYEQVLQEEKVRANKRLGINIDQLQTGGVTSPADKQFLLLSEYHSQGLAQSRISFWFSLISAAVGFIVIVVAITRLDGNPVRLTADSKTFVTLIAGTIIEATSALFFVQSNKARQLMIEFFDKLRTDRKLDEALKLAETMADHTTKGKLQFLLALSFAEVTYDKEVLSPIFNQNQPIERVSTGEQQ